MHDPVETSRGMPGMISIVIPTYKERVAIGPMLGWIREKLTLPHEVIVADGGSDDGTYDAALPLADRVVVMRHTSPSPARQRNQGGRAARGEFIAFLDCEVSIPYPNDFFAHALARFRADPELVALTGPQQVRGDVETWADRLNFGFLNLSININNNVFHRGEASGKCMLVRKQAFDAVGGLRDDLITREDGDFFLRLSKIGKTRYDPHLRVYHGGRRAHRIGWIRLWWVWTINTIWVALFDKARVEEWVPIREYDHTPQEAGRRE